MVFQHYSRTHWLTVMENIKFFAGA